jgi:crotonobetainyl-CoA:carnitine CoA-transferase CaiB-like acyl-CoA transferase
MNGLLDGVKVLDLSRAMAGPYATMLLGDYGADIIKIEEPERGDETRQWYPPKIDDLSAYFVSVNRNKRSLAVDLKSSEGLEIFYKLVESADVVVQNFRPGVPEKLKIDYQCVSKINPSIIYCSISGFGQTGPNKDLPGYDLTVFAMGGIMSFTGEPDRPPVRLSIPQADIGAGLYAVTAILAALNCRQLHGEGQSIDISMQDVQISLLTHQAMNYFATGKNPEKVGSAHPNLVPYQAFKGSDDYFVLAMGNDKLWSDFCKEIGKSSWAEDSRFQTNPDRLKNRTVLIQMLDDLFASMPAEHWVGVARKAGVPAGPISKVSEVLSDRHVLQREMVTEVQSPKTGNMIKQLGVPAKFSKSTTKIRLSPPHLGEHSLQILRELGYEDITIKNLSEKDIIKST